MNVDYLHICTAMSGQFYADLLLMLQESIKDKRQGQCRRGVARRQDNTPVHINQFDMHTVCDHGFKWLPRPPYFMDLVPSDFFLFQKENGVQGPEICNDNELTLAVEEFCRECGSAIYGLARNGVLRFDNTQVCVYMLSFNFCMCGWDQMSFLCLCWARYQLSEKFSRQCERKFYLRGSAEPFCYQITIELFSQKSYATYLDSHRPYFLFHIMFDFVYRVGAYIRVGLWHKIHTLYPTDSIYV